MFGAALAGAPTAPAMALPREDGGPGPGGLLSRHYRGGRPVIFATRPYDALPAYARSVVSAGGSAPPLAAACVHREFDIPADAELVSRAVDHSGPVAMAVLGFLKPV